MQQIPTDLKIKNVKWEKGVYLEPIQGTDENPYECEFLYSNEDDSNNYWILKPALNNKQLHWLFVIRFNGSIKQIESWP